MENKMSDKYDASKHPFQYPPIYPSLSRKQQSGWGGWAGRAGRVIQPAVVRNNQDKWRPRVIRKDILESPSWNKQQIKSENITNTLYFPKTNLILWNLLFFIYNHINLYANDIESSAVCILLFAGRCAWLRQLQTKLQDKI